MYIQSYIHTYIHTYINTHIHTVHTPQICIHTHTFIHIHMINKSVSYFISSDAKRLVGENVEVGHVGLRVTILGVELLITLIKQSHLRRLG